MKKHYFLPFLALFLSLFLINNSIFAQVKTDVWDFGAEQLDVNQYNNMLDVATINSWYSTSITPGSVSTSNVFPSSFPSVGGLSWNGGSNDRLRSTNTNLTRYDANLGGVADYTGRLYQNGAGVEPPLRYFTFSLNEDDEVTLVTRADATGKMNFFNSATGQYDSYEIGSNLVSLRFVAKTTGNYRIYDSSGKPSYYRIYRKPATYAALSGVVDISNATDIPAGYTLTFTNEAGKIWSATPDASHNYSIQLPIGNTYQVGLGNANGYIISGNSQITLNENSVYNPAVLKITLNTLSGTIQGLTTDLLSKLSLTFTPSTSSVFSPNPVINQTTGAYSVQLESGVDYTISANSVNDYFLSESAIKINQNTSKDLVFALKPTYKVNINALGLTAEQISKLNLKFSNLNEAGYTYQFADINNIYLRNGVYQITASGLDDYPLQLALTSNLTVNDAEVSKDIRFNPVAIWSFDDKPITSTTTAYKGMLFSGAPYNEQAKGHLVLKNNDTAKVPVEPGQKMIVTYYYSAKFTVDGANETSTSSGSTSQFESKEFIYEGTAAGFMTIENVAGSTTYITEVRVAKIVPFVNEITVGVDKNYQTINDALDAVRSMNRAANDTVKIMIDPGNYEEMLVIDVPNVALINASENPNIILMNKGVDISPNAVRITGYYGHGYNYFSMANDQKWDAEILRVNKENGYTTYTNTGSGTGNNSYWNATVLVSAPGFYAENIIFENSYNQYISKKESEDVLVEWSSGGKGIRPKDVGNTSVQNKSFVERAAAIAYTKSGDKSVLYKCRVIGRQDSFFGAEGARVVAFKGSLMGATDYIFGGMTLVGYQTELAMNTSETGTDVAYITAAQQNTSRGFLFYECTVTSAVPGSETASAYLSKPGYFGRPWQANTSEVVFYNTTINTSDNPNFVGKSLIVPEGWNNSLGGTSDKVYEYGTIEKSGVNNAPNRASWSKVLTAPTLTDGTEINTFNFTKGNDGWDPIPMLKVKDSATGFKSISQSKVEIYSVGNEIVISKVNEVSAVEIFGIDGKLLISEKINQDSKFQLNHGFWIVKVSSEERLKTAKVFVGR